MDPDASNEFGRLLRDWRRLRGRSQLNLALDADVSSRHVSFIENGRSRPSREMVLRLTEALDVPLRDRNTFLAAAGYASLYRHSTLDAGELEPALNALRFMLERHEPYPAFVVDRVWNLLLANDASQALLDACGLSDDVRERLGTNMMRLTLHPDGLKPVIENWSEVAEALLTRARQEAAVAFGDDPMKDILREVHGYPGIDDLVPRPDHLPRAAPVIPLRIRIGDERLSWFSIIATFGTPQDVTLQEIRLETLAPADEATEKFAQAMAR